MHEIHGTAMHYPWGTSDAIPAILGIPADGRPFAHFVSNFGCVEQGLCGDAATVEAGATNFVTFNQRDSESQLCCPHGRGITAASCAEHHDVEFLRVSHVPLPRARNGLVLVG